MFPFAEWGWWKVREEDGGWWVEGGDKGESRNGVALWRYFVDTPRVRGQATAVAIATFPMTFNLSSLPGKEKFIPRALMMSGVIVLYGLVYFYLHNIHCMVVI